jgi:hypothetical protein
MDQVVQMNASLVEEATAAASSMASQAEDLARSVARFRVEGDVAVPRRDEARRAPPAGASHVASTTLPARAPARPALKVAGDEAEWQEF